MPKVIGPYKVTKSHPEILRYTLDLLPELKARRIVPLFHVSLLRQYHKRDDTIFPTHEVRTFLHGTTSYTSGLVLLGEHKFYYISINSYMGRCPIV
jgi:hypothetical protein